MQQLLEQEMDQIWRYGEDVSSMNESEEGDRGVEGAEGAGAGYIGDDGRRKTTGGSRL
jgi:hypothetical protein